MSIVAQRSRLALAAAFGLGALVAVAWNVVPSVPQAAPQAANSMVGNAAMAAASTNVHTAGVGSPVFADIIERVKPAVVTIIVESRRTALPGALAFPV